MLQGSAVRTWKGTAVFDLTAKKSYVYLLVIIKSKLSLLYIWVVIILNRIRSNFNYLHAAFSIWFIECKYLQKSVYICTVFHKSLMCKGIYNCKTLKENFVKLNAVHILQISYFYDWPNRNRTTTHCILTDVIYSLSSISWQGMK
jgi:hypothetical protein